MHIAIRDDMNTPHPLAAEGELHIEEQTITQQHIGTPLRFTITRDFSDFPIDVVSSRGQLATMGTARWYVFKVLETQDQPDGTRTGSLVIVSAVP